MSAAIPASALASPTIGGYAFAPEDYGTAVTGVEFEWQGTIRSVKASSEVVLSAGAIQTPKILMLSGIGDRAELARFGIPTISHLPGVGQNFQDHPIIGSGLWETT